MFVYHEYKIKILFRFTPFLLTSKVFVFFRVKTIWSLRFEMDKLATLEPRTPLISDVFRFNALSYILS